MVVDDGDLAALFQDLLALHLADLVCIDHDAQSLLGNDAQGAAGVDEIPLLTGVLNGVDQAGGQGGFPLDGDDGGHIADLADPQHPFRRTDGVQIAHPMAHDDHMVGGLDQPHQSLGHNAAAHLAALFHAMADAAVEGEAVGGHLGGLVAAAALGHIQSLHRHLLGFVEGGGPPADADGDGQVDAGLQGPDLVQHIVALLGELLQLALLHHGDVAPVGHPAQKTGAPGDHGLDGAVDPLQQTGALTVQHVAEHVVVAVHREDHITRTAGLVFQLDPAQGGLIVEDQDADLLPLPLDGGGMDAPGTADAGQHLAVRAGALGHIQSGQHLVHASGQLVPAGQDPVPERQVIPHHRIPAEQGRRLGQGRKAVLGAGIFKAGAGDPAGRPPADAVARHHHQDDAHHRHHQHHRAQGGLYHQQQQGQRRRQQRKAHCKHFQRPSGFLLHGGCLFSPPLREDTLHWPGRGAACIPSAAASPGCPRGGRPGGSAAQVHPARHGPGGDGGHTSISTGRIMGLRLVRR